MYLYAGGSGASSVMQFYTNDSERMRIDASGKVGIGSTSPSQKLDVVGAVSASTYYGDGSNLQNVTSVAGAAGPQYSVQVNNTGTAVSGSSQFIFNPSNNRVGIGTNAPSSILHISELSPTVTIQRENNGNNSTLQFLLTEHFFLCTVILRLFD